VGPANPVRHAPPSALPYAARRAGIVVHRTLAEPLATPIVTLET
jgi:hypothetical protein